MASDFMKIIAVDGWLEKVARGEDIQVRADINNYIYFFSVKIIKLSMRQELRIVRFTTSGSMPSIMKPGEYIVAFDDTYYRDNIPSKMLR